MNNVFTIILVLCIAKSIKCFPHEGPVYSKYARVTMWGQNNTDNMDSSVGRSSKSGNIWNHRLDPHNISPTINHNPSVVYQYPVYQEPTPKAARRIEHVPGIGEVIVAEAQDRFEPRPLFAYKKKTISPTYVPPPASKDNAPPSDTTSVPPPSNNMYNSPYSSYNPPDFKPDQSNSGLYPPIGKNPEDSKPPTMEKDTSPSKTPDSYVSLGPPMAYGDNVDTNFDHPEYDHHDDSPPEDPMEPYKQQDGPPDYPPNNEDDIYYPPDFPQDQKQGHDTKNSMMPMAMPMDDGKANGNMVAPEEHGSPDHSPPELGPPELGPPEHGPPEHGPPEHDYEQGHAFPQYLYDQHHYDHHVYEEVPHTTMAPAKEDKRVSSTHYSYYYLGRKLWYIPLYFSVYFIIYVTVLIVKSIVRHKVKLKYKWFDHDHHKGRSLDLGTQREEKLNDINNKVSTGLRNATAKFETVMAMK
ncbi:hypothetical protein ABEB36_010647 [Hypothenemus hampei]|uniref:Uncharacterized protein n=1 Tax=Hypothenemus hampei TaxID=57062 RepID=A0ABD1ECW7_HYPHA